MSETDFKLDFITSRLVKEEHSGSYGFDNLVKINKILFNGNYSHGFIIRNKDKTKQKTIKYAPPGLKIAYCSGFDGTDPTYDIFSYIFERFNDKLIESRDTKQPMYLVYNDELQKLLDQTETENVTKKGGARRKSKNVKNVKRSRSKSRKSRKQRKSNKNRRTKYYKK